MLFFVIGCLLGEAERVEVDMPLTNVKQFANSKYRSANNTSVKVIIQDGDNEAGHGSGNYFRHKGKEFVLTAAHVVSGENEFYILDGEEKVGIRIVFIDFEADVAIIIPKKQLKTIKATKWSQSKNRKIGSKTVYAGWPAYYGKTLLTGLISAVQEHGIIIHSFALPGSSGSVVFDSSGRVLGVVSSIGLYMGAHSPFPSLQEDLVYVTSVAHLTDKRLSEVLECGG